MDSNLHNAENFLSSSRPDICKIAAAIAEPSQLYHERAISSANLLKLRINGKKVTFVVNRNVNFTNVCMIDCLFCGYSVRPGDTRSYLLTKEDILDKVSLSLPLGITEVCITGGLNPKLTIEYLSGMLKAITIKFPKLHIHAFSPMEIAWLAAMEGASVRDVLLKLKDAGLGSMPGTAAEILVDDVRRIICPGKIGTADWIKIIKTAHSLGIPTTATIMFGHVETPRDIAEHLVILRDIQEETGGFTEFVPLPFVPFKTALKNRSASSLDIGYVQRVHVVSRLLFGELIPNIQVSWTKLGIDSARSMLHAGVSDIGGTLVEENITRLAGGYHGQYLSRDQMIRIIREEGFEPFERDTIYSRLSPA